MRKQLLLFFLFNCICSAVLAQNTAADSLKQLLVTTKKENGSIAIMVADNGNGIPQNVVDKIFQPFFTAKLTGQGTDLGLSLSYDIIKAHGGAIKVETKVDERYPDNFGKGEGTTFIIQLPYNP